MELGDIVSLLVFDISLAHYLLKPFILGFTQRDLCINQRAGVKSALDSCFGGLADSK